MYPIPSLVANLRPEADFLADRIGIMVKGGILCTGTAIGLKRTHGSGYKLTLTCPSDEVTRSNINRYSYSVQPNASFLESVLTCHRIFQSHVSVVYEFDGTADALAKLVQELEQRREELGVLDWGISQATLDDVFLQLCGGAGHDG
jgi:ABC-type multidrug transport system ATPase subunit